MREIKKYGIAAGAGALAVLVMLSGIFFSMDALLSDSYYQNPVTVDERIVIVGIDERALLDIGPYQTWQRDIMAGTIERLNEDPENRPAVIGLDVLYTGETEQRLDERLVQAAEAYGNVVTASVAQYGSELVENRTGFYMKDFSVLGFEEAFPRLRSVTGQGHINAMLDRDGILRHVLSRVELADGRTVPSFSDIIARTFLYASGGGELSEPPTDERGFWYLPFQGPPGAYDDGISVSDVLNGEIPPEYFAGKIVLIGPYTAGLNDSYFTSTDHAEAMYGVEYQANAIGALLAGSYRKEAPEAVQGIALFLIVFLGMLWFGNRSLAASAASYAGGVAGWFLTGKLLYEAGVLLSVFYVPFALTVLFVASVAFNYLKAAMERKKVTTTFKRYVAPEIVNEIMKEGTEHLELGGKLCDIAVLFVDIRGFTTMSELLTPTMVVDILNRYLSLTSACILKNHGTLDKFLGDSTMAIWGAPIAQEDYVMHAARAAMDMVEESRALEEELKEQLGRTVSFGIGLHMGPAVVGNVGAKIRMDYTAIGDTVNTAARLEANAPGGKIYISRAVADALEGRIEAVSLGDSIQLKGKKAGFEILELKKILNGV